MRVEVGVELYTTAAGSLLRKHHEKKSSITENFIEN